MKRNSFLGKPIVLSTTLATLSAIGMDRDAGLEMIRNYKHQAYIVPQKDQSSDQDKRVWVQDIDQSSKAIEGLARLAAGSTNSLEIRFKSALALGESCHQLRTEFCKTALIKLAEQDKTPNSAISRVALNLALPESAETIQTQVAGNRAAQEKTQKRSLSDRLLSWLGF